MFLDNVIFHFYKGGGVNHLTGPLNPNVNKKMFFLMKASLRQTPQNHVESTVKRKSQCAGVTALDWGLMFLKIASINFRSRD